MYLIHLDNLVLQRCYDGTLWMEWYKQNRHELHHVCNARVHI